jgi:RNA polymerase sigma-70 factor (ECF subfamily)
VEAPAGHKGVDMAEGQDEFAALMARVQLGDREALLDLLGCYERQVQRVARHLLGRKLQPRLDPSDLLQSVHRTLILGLRDNKVTVRSEQNLVNLAVAVARNKIARAARDLRYQERHACPLAETAQPAATATRCEQDDPARLIEHADVIEKVFERLDESERALLRLRLEGHSTAEVARLLGQNADVLRVRLSRLRQRLRECNLLSQWI